MSRQFHSNIPNFIFMVRPSNFGFNHETAASNAFQQQADLEDVAQKAEDEFDGMLALLEAKGVKTHVVLDQLQLPDAVFPNNWISQHPNYGLVIYPMLSELRQKEVNLEAVAALKNELNVDSILDLRNAEGILEGTGSIIFDHESRTMFACVSERTDVKLLSALAEKIGYTSVSFQAVDVQGQAIYHTNVMLSISDKYAVVCLESIEDVLERAMLKSRLEKIGKHVIPISFTQMNQFLANCLEVLSEDGSSLLVMSSTAANSLTENQKSVIELYSEIVAVTIDTIEQIGGGSARCMMAGFYCPK